MKAKTGIPVSASPVGKMAEAPTFKPILRFLSKVGELLPRRGRMVMVKRFVRAMTAIRYPVLERIAMRYTGLRRKELQAVLNVLERHAGP